MSIPLPLLQSIESLLNKALQANLAKQIILAELADKVFAFHLQGLETTVYVLPHPQGVYLLNHYDGDADVTVSGLPLTLLRYLSVAQADDSKINVTGDKNLLEDFLLLSNDLSIDWEILLEEKTDGVLSNKIITALQEIGRWRDQYRDKITQNASKAIQKSKLLPTFVELEHFTDELTQLEQDVDKLADKINILSN